MIDTDKPDPVLQQVPLAKNPAFQPPKPVTLNTNYTKFLPTLSKTVVPPKLNLTEDDINDWIKSLEELKGKVNDEIDDAERKEYLEWLHLQQRKVAPGFNFESVMVPTTTGEKKTETPITNEANKTTTEETETLQSTNELDTVFGKVSLDPK